MEKVIKKDNKSFLGKGQLRTSLCLVTFKHDLTIILNHTKYILFPFNSCFDLCLLFLNNLPDTGKIESYI